MLPNPLFEFFGKGVHMYGICIALGLVSCLFVFYNFTKRKGMPTQVQDYIFFVLIGGLASGFFFAMFFQAFYNWLAGKPFNIFGAGLTVMGGLVGGASCFLILYFVVGRFYFKGKKKGLHIKYFNTLIRVAPICIAVAHGFGRIGCLMSGCCHGAYLGTEYVFGGIWMKGTTNGWGYYVPTQLYEALFLFALAAVMSILLFKRCNITMQIYLIGYGVWRFLIEFARTDYRGGSQASIFSPSQIQSIIFIALGLVILVIYLIKKWPLFFPKDNVNELLVVDGVEGRNIKKTNNLLTFGGGKANSLILASNSPRRKQLLQEGGFEFTVIKSDFIEKTNMKNPIDAATFLAEGKAKDVYFNLDDKTGAVVLGADTIVCLDGEILGKAKDEESARKTLTLLSGKTHKVITGFCLIYNDSAYCDYEQTEVTFNQLTPEQIDEYINSGLYVGKAGAYGIQDGFDLVKEISGSLNNVIGLPTEKVFPLLKDVLN